MCYKHICKLPKESVSKLEGAVKELNIYLITDSNIEVMEEIEAFGEDLFGELGMNRWGIVPQIRHGNIFVLKETSLGEIIGLAIFMRDFNDINECYLFDYAIASEFQGKNIGYFFLKYIAIYYKDYDFSTMTLMCDVNNERAVKLYRDKLNFRMIETHQDEYGIGAHRCVFELNLKDFN